MSYRKIGLVVLILFIAGFMTPVKAGNITTLVRDGESFLALTPAGEEIEIFSHWHVSFDSAFAADLTRAQLNSLVTDAIRLAEENQREVSPWERFPERDEAVMLDVSGNNRVTDDAFEAAEAGFDFTTRYIEQVFDDQTLRIELRPLPRLDNGVLAVTQTFATAFDMIGYPLALGENLQGEVLSELPHCRITYAFLDQDDRYYFGLDGDTPDGLYNFVELMAHEIGHALTFATSSRIEEGRGIVGNYIYSRFFYYQGENLYDNRDNEEWVAEAFLSEELVYRCDDEDVDIYSPDEWDQGGSLTHTLRGIMSPFQGAGVPFDGEIGREYWLITRTNGWTVSDQAFEENQAPIWDLSESVEGVENQVLEFDFSISDPEEDELEFSFSSDDLPDGWRIEMEGNEGTFTWDSPSFDDAGMYTLVCIASDAEHEISRDVTIVVINHNRAPVFNEVDDQEVNEDEELGFFITFEDPDGDTMDLEGNNLPEGAEIVRVTNTRWAFAWTPGFDIASQDEVAVEFAIHFRVTDELSNDEDEALVDQLTVDIIVNNVNRAPVLDRIDDQTVRESDTLEIDISDHANDPDGDGIDYSYASEHLPFGAGFDGSQFYCLPGYDDEGEYDVTFIISDGDLEDRQTITITISNTNRPPEMAEVENQQTQEADTLEFVLEAQDPDENGLSFWTEGLPEGASLEEATGEFHWTPTFNQGNETYEVTFGVTDDDGEDPLSDSVVVQIIVWNVNRPPELLQGIEDLTADEDCGLIEIADLDTVFMDPDQEDILSYLVDGHQDLRLVIGEEDHILRAQPIQNFNLPEGVNITVIASDTSEATSTDEFSFVINAVNDAPSPFDLLNPSDGSEVSIDRETCFSWQESNDVDGDEVEYSLYLQIEYEALDTTIVWEVLETTSFSVSLDSVLVSHGIYTEEPSDEKVICIWGVIASDGELERESDDWRTLILPVPMDVDESMLNLPEEFSLGQNYPNPFNAVTTIPFNLPTAADVRIDIYNINGQLVETLVNERKIAGYHSVVWSGRSVSSGMYIFMMKSGDFRTTRRIMLVK